MRRHQTVAKIAVVGLVCLLLVVPLLLLQGVVSERSQRRHEVEVDILHGWGGQLTLAGPVLTVPYVVHTLDANGRRVDNISAVHFLPRVLTIDARLAPQTRSRGMYEMTVSDARISVEGTFERPDFSGVRASPSDILWDSAFLSMELPDMRAIQESAELTWGGRRFPFHSGSGNIGMFAGGIRADLPGLRANGVGGTGVDGTGVVPFSFSLSLHGGDSVSFLPLGDETRVHVQSSWPSPNFNGSFLPTDRKLGPGGFDASWHVVSMARAYSQRWRDGDVVPQTLLESGFGVNLMTPVDIYQKMTRALKYSLLFLALPFCTFFLYEILARRRVHPLQYLLVGLGDVVFYLLVLSLAEHMSFGLAYLIAAAACAVLLTLYAVAVMRSRTGLLMLPVLGTGYGFLALVLSSEDNALLMGAIGLFLVLGAAMFLTRKVDWYRREHSPPIPP